MSAVDFLSTTLLVLLVLLMCPGVQTLLLQISRLLLLFAGLRMALLLQKPLLRLHSSPLTHPLKEDDGEGEKKISIRETGP